MMLYSRVFKACSRKNILTCIRKGDKICDFCRRNGFIRDAKKRGNGFPLIVVANVAIQQSAVSPPRKERIINLIDTHMVLYSRVFKVCSGKIPSLEERGIRVEALVEEKALLEMPRKGEMCSSGWQHMLLNIPKFGSHWLLPSSFYLIQVL